jgi:hypothetical protein
MVDARDGCAGATPARPADPRSSPVTPPLTRERSRRAGGGCPEQIARYLTGYCSGPLGPAPLGRAGQRAARAGLPQAPGARGRQRSRARPAGGRMATGDRSAPEHATHVRVAVGACPHTWSPPAAHFPDRSASLLDDQGTSRAVEGAPRSGRRPHASGASSCATSPARRADWRLEAAGGFEPPSNGFADRRLNHLATPPFQLLTAFRLGNYTVSDHSGPPGDRRCPGLGLRSSDSGRRPIP